MVRTLRAAAVLQNGYGQRRALGGVGARAQLVEQHQRSWRHLLAECDTMLVMWAEKVDRDCSMDCSSPMSANTSSNTASSVPSAGRDLQPGLRHQGKQAHGFQRDGLAAGVGAGDDQRGKVLPQPQIAGHHLFRVDEGMPSADDLEPSLPR